MRKDINVRHHKRHINNNIVDVIEHKRNIESNNQNKIPNRYEKQNSITSMSDVYRLNAAKGFHFFEPDAMKFFKSKIETHGNLINNKYFITSEQFTDVYNNIREPRKYTIRSFNNKTGDVNTIGEFQDYRTYIQALRAAEKM